MTEVVFRSTYRVTEVKTGKVFTRNVALMAPYHGSLSAVVAPSVDAAASKAADDAKGVPGDVVAVTDEPGASVWLMKVSGSVDGMLSGQYYAPSSPSCYYARGRLVVTDLKY